MAGSSFSRSNACVALPRIRPRARWLIQPVQTLHKPAGVGLPPQMVQLLEQPSPIFEAINVGEEIHVFASGSAGSERSIGFAQPRGTGYARGIVVESNLPHLHVGRHAADRMIRAANTRGDGPERGTIGVVGIAGVDPEMRPGCGCWSAH